MAIAVRRQGAAKAEPFTVLIVANIALEAPINTGQLLRDPITSNQTAFDAAVDYIEDALFGNLPNQSEQLLGDPALSPDVRLLTWFSSTAPTNNAHCFASQDAASTLLIAHRQNITAFLQPMSSPRCFRRRMRPRMSSACSARRAASRPAGTPLRSCNSVR